MGYLLALIPPFLDSIANYLDKILLSKSSISSKNLTIYSGFFAFFTGALIFIFTGFSLIDITSAMVLILCGFLGIFYYLAYFKALTYDEGSRVGSLFQFIPVFVLLLSFIFLGEHLSPKQYLGSFFIITAGFLLSAKRVNGILAINKAFWFMILSCFFSALVYILFKVGVERVGFWESLPYEGLGAGLATLVILFYKNHYKVLFGKRLSTKLISYIAIIEVLVRISRYILFFVLTLIPASIASVLMGFQPLFLVIIGIILSVWYPYLIKEVVNKKTIKIKLLSVITIFVGLSLIFL